MKGVRWLQIVVNWKYEQLEEIADPEKATSMN